MNEFRILSIEELDAEFVTRLRVSADPPKTDNTLIPEFVKTKDVFFTKETTAEEVFETDNNAKIISDYLSADHRPVSHPNTENTDNNPRPIIPLGQGKPFYSSDVNGEEAKILSEEDFESETKPKKRKGIKGLIFAKIICILMLVSTLVTFVFGCFVSVFINNSSVDIKGISFNTLANDAALSKETLREGDLIISQRKDYAGYADNLNKPIAVPADREDTTGCKIEYIHFVTQGTGGETYIQTYRPDDGIPSGKQYDAENTMGIVIYYVPFVGGIITFALSSPILICVLFVLMIAFWCLIMILIEKTIKRRKLFN